MMLRILGPIALALLLSVNFLTIFSHGLLGLGSDFTGGTLILLVIFLILTGIRRRFE